MALLVMGPKLWLLLSVWLAGVWLYAGRRGRPLARWQARAGCLATVALLIAFKLAGVDIAPRVLGTSVWPFPFIQPGSAERYLADYLVCAIVCLHFLCARQAGFGALARFARPIRALASYTFTLYLVHGPVMGLWSELHGDSPASALDNGMLAAWIFAATWGVGRVTEHRKHWFRRQFESLYLHAARRVI